MFTLKFSTANDAFGTTLQDRNDEIARILGALVDELYTGRIDEKTNIPVVDSNGNTIGRLTIADD